MAIRITDDAMTPEFAVCVVTPAWFSEYAVADGHDAWNARSDCRS